MTASKQFDKNEGVTLINILILEKILNTSVAGHTVTLETSSMKVIYSYLILSLFHISVKVVHLSLGLSHTLTKADSSHNVIAGMYLLAYCLTYDFELNCT